MCKLRLAIEARYNPQVLKCESLDLELRALVTIISFLYIIYILVFFLVYFSF